MNNYHLPLISTICLFLSACGAGSPLENTAATPTAPATGAAISEILVPIDAANSGDTGESNEAGNSGSSNTDTSITDSSDSGSTGPDSNDASDTTTSDPGSITLPVTCSASDDVMRVRMLDLINTARATARSCGTTNYEAALPLIWDTQLFEAATAHSQDMAQHNFFDHTGSDGSNVGDRATSAGYNWQRVGENIAAGQTNAENVVTDWIESPGHCRNLMNSNFTDVSVTCVEDSGGDYVRYWTQVFGKQF